MKKIKLKEYSDNLREEKNKINKELNEKINAQN